MKKNVMMRLSALLLVAVLLTTCVISGTFAKYVTSGEAGDEARVAKWGVTVTVTGDEAFGTKYNDAIEAEGTKVISANGDNVLAPGTNGTLGSVTISGAPEVRVSVAVDLTITLTGWEIRVTDTNSDGDIDEDDDAEFYCPLVISDGTTTLNGTDYTSAAAFKAAIELLVDSAAAEVAANTSLARSVTLTWAWAFDVDDVKDTALGDLATAPTIAAEWTASVTQVD